MNKEIIKTYRDFIELKLSKLPEPWQKKFIRIYGKPKDVAICRLDDALNLIEDNIKRGPA